MSNDQPDLDHEALTRRFESIVHGESHAHQVRLGLLTTMSTLAWDAGFQHDRRVLLTADAVRSLSPSGHDVTDLADLADELNQRLRRVLIEAARCAKTCTRQAFAAFDCQVADHQAPTTFTIAVETFGSPDPVVVIGSADTNLDAAPQPL